MFRQPLSIGDRRREHVQDLQRALEPHGFRGVLGGDAQTGHEVAGAPYPGALAAWAQGRLDGEATLLHCAADELAALGFGYESAVARLDLAELTETQTDAVGECLQVLERLGAQPQVEPGPVAAAAPRANARPPHPGSGGRAR